MTNNNNSVMDAIRESFDKIPTPFSEENGNVTSVMQSSPKFSEILEKSRKVMDLVESRANNNQRPAQAQNTYQYTGNQMNTQHTPSLFESLRQTPPMSGDNFQNMMVERTTPQQVKFIPETRTNTQSVTQSNVDYSLIKMIVNECIKENLQQIKESLNENVIRGIKINPGGIIQVLDKNNTLYEGQLKVKQRK